MSCRNYRILIVDQDSVSRENTARLLRSLGYTDIFEAGDGSEAIARCERINFDAILTEIDTQPLGGLGFLAALRGADGPLIPTRNTTTPLLVLTSQTRPDIIRRARQLGAAAYLLKPVCAARLAKALRQATVSGGPTVPDHSSTRQESGCENLVVGVS